MLQHYGFANSSQIASFCDDNDLSLNANNTELIKFSNGGFCVTNHDIAWQIIPTQSEAKCLGVWWRHDLSPVKFIEKCIHKSRQSFFALGSIGAFHGRLNPLTGHSLFETFVIPTLLYGCETWIVSEPLLKSLESFQENGSPSSTPASVLASVFTESQNSTLEAAFSSKSFK